MLLIIITVVIVFVWILNARCTHLKPMETLNVLKADYTKLQRGCS